MSTLLVDTSVLIKWFHATGEAELEAARSLRSAQIAGTIDARILDLGVYEVGNVLVRSLGWPAADVAEQLDDLLALCGVPLVLSAEWLHDAATLAAEHRLTFYDAAWAAAARGLGVPLVSADRQLLDVSLAESPSRIVERIRL